MLLFPSFSFFQFTKKEEGKKKEPLIFSLFTFFLLLFLKQSPLLFCLIE